MAFERYQPIRDKGVIYDDDNVKLKPRNAAVEMCLTAIRAVFRCIWFVVGSFLLSLLFVVMVKPAKLSAILQLHWEDLRDVKCKM